MIDLLRALDLGFDNDALVVVLHHLFLLAASAKHILDPAEKASLVQVLIASMSFYWTWLAGAVGRGRAAAGAEIPRRRLARRTG